MSDVITIEAETDAPSNSPTDFPSRITGEFIHAAADEISELRFAPGVTVSLRGRRYMLEFLEQDGSFAIRRDW